VIRCVAGDGSSPAARIDMVSTAAMHPPLRRWVMSVGSAIFARSPLTPQLRTLRRQATIVDKGQKRESRLWGLRLPVGGERFYFDRSIIELIAIGDLLLTSIRCVQPMRRRPAKWHLPKLSWRAAPGIVFGRYHQHRDNRASKIRRQRLRQ
jgi:hypothetical protein